MTKTEYLFGHKKEKYGTELERIAKERIEDGRILLGELYDQINYDPNDRSNKQYELRQRIGKVSTAIEVWKKILEVEDGG